MSKIILVALLLATPIAAAGDGIDINPPTESECSFQNGHNSTYNEYSGDWYRSWSWSSEGGQAYACSERDDVIDGGVFANGNEVVDVNVGSGGSYQSSQREEGYGYGSEWWSNESSASWGSGSWSSSEANGYAYGFDATVSTLVADVSFSDGCASRSGRTTQQTGEYGSWSGPYGSGHSSRSTSDQSTHESSGCGHGVAADSGVTDASAGRTDACRSDSGSRYEESSWSDSHYSSSTSSSSSGYASACDNMWSAALGEESGDVGSQSDCYGHSFSGTDPWHGSPHSYDSYGCESRTGIWGPTDLGIYLEERSESSEYCDADGYCSSYAYESDALVVEHAYTGRIAYYLA